MEYYIYRLEFQGAVRFGRRALEDAEYTFGADTLFSALCQEAVKQGDGLLEKLCRFTAEDELLYSDAFPYMGDAFYLPKPIRRIETAGEQGDSVRKKAYKKLRYLPADDLDRYLRGEYDVLSARSMDELGHFDMRVSASIRGEEEAKPYRVGVFYYQPGNGLYVIAGFRDREVMELSDRLMQSLAAAGIGGRRSAGMGRFHCVREKLPDSIARRLNRDGEAYMTLSVSLPREDEMQAALLGAEYLLHKRSGFVASESYAEEWMRKKDLYVMATGSCFRIRYRGDVYDVSDRGGRHPVYRYAKPMFMEVGV